MSTTTIGIKVADRSYFPILEKGKASRKRLVLTTVKDDQQSVQIDLYESEADDMEAANYVGSLLIENIESAPAGDAEVELLIGVDGAGSLTASASEPTSGETQSVEVSLQSLGAENVYDLPEFELDAEDDTADSGAAAASDDEAAIGDLSQESEEFEFETASFDDEVPEMTASDEGSAAEPSSGSDSGEIDDGGFEGLDDVSDFGAEAAPSDDDLASFPDEFAGEMDEGSIDTGAAEETFATETGADDLDFPQGMDDIGSTTEDFGGADEDSGIGGGGFQDQYLADGEDPSTIAPNRRPLMLGLFISLGVAAIVLVAFILFRVFEGPKVPPLRARDGESTQTVASSGQTTDAERGDGQPASGGGPSVASATDDGPVAVSQSTGIDGPRPSDELGGTWYWIRQGDTLWELSAAFYRNPRLFGSIADHNQIHDRDLIFAGARIYIPPR